jgi:predicted dehydrogenase
MNGKKTGFGVVGAGLWGEAHAEVYATSPYAELAAVCDLDRTRAERVAKRFGNPKVFTDFREMIRDPGVDAVAVVTPDFAHRDAVVAAAEAGKHVISEKPLATTREDAGAIAAAVRKAGITYMVDFHARWSPPFVITRKDIGDGAYGRIVSAYVRLNDTISVPTSMLSWASKSSILWFLGSHAVDILRFLFRDEVARVYAVSRDGVLKERGVDVPDLYQAILEFRSGIVATIENHWIAPNSNPMVNDFKVNVLGSKGMVNMDLTHHAMIERYFEASHDRPDTIVKPLIRDAHAGFAYHSIRDFVECLALGKPVQAGLEDGLAVTAVILAILDSAASRTPVTVRY